MRGKLSISMIAVVAAGLAAASRAGAETIDELYQKAKAEGELSFVGGGPIRAYEGIAKDFEQRFPGIKVKITGGYSGSLAPMIDKQIAEKKLQVDFVTFQAVQEFARWKAEGVLQPIKTDAFDMSTNGFAIPTVPSRR